MATFGPFELALCRGVCSSYDFHSRSIASDPKESLFGKSILLSYQPGANVSWTTLAMVVSFLALVVGDDNENDASHRYNHEHEDEHHLDQLVYYSIAILPILALFILLPMCCSMLGARRRDRDIKID